MTLIYEPKTPAGEYNARQHELIRETWKCAVGSSTQWYSMQEISDGMILGFKLIGGEVAEPENLDTVANLLMARRFIDGRHGGSLLFFRPDKFVGKRGRYDILNKCMRS